LESADTEPRPGEASQKKDKVAAMKMQLERKLCALQKGK
jgi:hypothetical protein